VLESETAGYLRTEFNWDLEHPTGE
jgi:hypothetical protein